MGSTILGRTPANKTHGTVEDVPRISAQDVAGQEFELIGTLPADFRGRGTAQCVEFRLVRDGAAVHLRTGAAGVIELLRLPVSRGGYRYLWRCPECSAPVKHLYLSCIVPVCRRCAGLNYRSQQQAHDFRAECRKAIEAYERIAPLPPVRTYVEALNLFPPLRPRRMHRKRYDRLVAEWRQAVKRANDAMLADMLGGADGEIIARIMRAKGTPGLPPAAHGD